MVILTASEARSLAPTHQSAYPAMIRRFLGSASSMRVSSKALTPSTGIGWAWIWNLLRSMLCITAPLIRADLRILLPEKISSASVVKFAAFTKASALVGGAFSCCRWLRYSKIPGSVKGNGCFLIDAAHRIQMQMEPA